MAGEGEGLEGLKPGLLGTALLLTRLLTRFPSTALIRVLYGVSFCLCLGHGACLSSDFSFRDHCRFRCLRPPSCSSQPSR